MKTLTLFILVNLISAPMAHSQTINGREVVIEQEYRVAAVKYGLDPVKFKALLFVESSLNHQAINPVTLDFGIAQINYKTAEAYKMDVGRLTRDRAYSIDRGAFVLSEFKKRYRGREPDSWVCRYNLGTRKTFTERQSKMCMEYNRKIRIAMEGL